MSPISTKVSIGIVLIVFGSGTVLVLGHKWNSTGAPEITLTAPLATKIHSSSWYIAHQDVLKADEATCANDIAALPQADCENADTAENQIYGAELNQNAKGLK